MQNDPKPWEHCLVVPTETGPSLPSEKRSQAWSEPPEPGWSSDCHR